MSHRPTADAHVSAEQFTALFRDLSVWGRWGEDDERGALHGLTPDRVAAAAQLVRDGVGVTLSLPLDTESGLKRRPTRSTCSGMD